MINDPIDRPPTLPLAYERRQVFTTTRTKLRVAVTGACACLVLPIGVVILVGTIVLLFQWNPRSDPLALFLAPAMLGLGAALGLGNV